MSKFIYGLNVTKSFSDIADPEIGLKNLGMDIRDLNIIRGISDAGVTKNDMIRVSGLDVDSRRQLSTIYSDLIQSTSLVSISPDIRFNIETDHIINNKIKAKSFKYNYIAYDQGNAILGADISTSRVSSWSSFEDPATSTSPILYGGDVEIIPTPATGSSQIRVTDLAFSTTPATRRFAAEVPTHLISMDVGGVTKQFYAMKGIPVVFQGYFRSANLNSIVSAYNNILPTWTITNLDNGTEYAPYENVALNFNLLFTDSRARPRKLELYYPPDNIRELRIDRINLTDWTDIVLTGLTSANVSFNDLRVMPDFASLTPNLLSLNVAGNNMSRAVDINGVRIVANTQLSTLPTSLTSLIIDGCFSDSTPIDISYLTNLQTLQFDSSYDINRGGGLRRYMGTGPTPRVNSNSIVNYTVAYQRYNTLDTSVTSSSTIRRVNIVGNSIVSDSDGNEIAFNNNANNMISFASYTNPHNIVNLSGHDNLTSYSHTYSRNLQGNTSIEGIFNGCDALQSISLISTDATGDFDGSIANLGALQTCDLRFTRIHGKVTAGSFVNTSSLVNLYLAGSFLGLNSNNPATATQYPDTFDVDAFRQLPALVNLYCYNASYVTGNLPDFSLNASLRYVYFHSTKLTGGLTSFNTNRSLQWLFVRYSNINQTLPKYTSPSLVGIYLNHNQIYGQLQAFECQNLAYLYLNNNNLGKDQSGNIDPSIGNIPTFIFSPRLQAVDISNNFLTTYTSGAFTNLTLMRFLSVANNQLSLQDIFSILSDLQANWSLRNRTGVRVDLRGNPNVTEAGILNDQIAGENLLFLRSRGWSIFV